MIHPSASFVVFIVREFSVFLTVVARMTQPAFHFHHPTEVPVYFYSCVEKLH